MYMIAEVSQYVAVASFAEAWIEIERASTGTTEAIVASFAEAWIEIHTSGLKTTLNLSPPSRRRGLKYLWRLYSCRLRGSRLLRGGVD